MTAHYRFTTKTGHAVDMDIAGYAREYAAESWWIDKIEVWGVAVSREDFLAGDYADHTRVTPAAGIVPADAIYGPGPDDQEEFNA